jgi:hypothetical protein
MQSLQEQLADWEDRGFGIFIHWSPSTAYQGRYKGQKIALRQVFHIPMGQV